MARVARHGVGYRGLESETGIPATTLRRYAKRFPNFLPCRVIDRASVFPVESVETFRRIHALYVEGRRTEEVAELLAAEVPRVHDLAGHVATVATTDPGDLSAMLPLLARLTVAVETLAAAQVETVALLREAREKASERPLVASETETRGEGRPGKENAQETPWWRFWLRRLVG